MLYNFTELSFGRDERLINVKMLKYWLKTERGFFSSRLCILPDLYVLYLSFTGEFLHLRRTFYTRYQFTRSEFT